MTPDRSRTCPSGHAVPREDAFCGVCGAEVLVACQNGHQVGASHDFCVECGAPLGVEPEAEIAEIDGAESGDGSQTMPTSRGPSNKRRWIWLVALTAVALVVVTVAVIVRGTDQDDRTATCIDTPGDTIVLGAPELVDSTVVDLRSTDLSISNGVLTARLTLSGEVPEDLVRRDALTYSVTLATSGGDTLYTLTRSSPPVAGSTTSGSEYGDLATPIDGTEASTGVPMTEGAVQSTVSRDTVTFTVGLGDMPQLPDEFAWSASTIFLVDGAQASARDRCPGQSAEGEQESLAVFPGNTEEEAPRSTSKPRTTAPTSSSTSTTQPVTTTEAPTTTAPSGEAQAKALFVELVQQACDPSITPDPTLASASTGAGGEYPITDADGTVLIINIGLETVAPVGGPDEIIPIKYQNCDAAIFLGAADA